MNENASWANNAIIVAVFVFVFFLIVLADTEKDNPLDSIVTVETKDKVTKLTSDSLDFSLAESVVCSGKPESGFKECIVSLPLENKKDLFISLKKEDLLLSFPSDVKDIQIQELKRDYYDANVCVKYNEAKTDNEIFCLEWVFKKNAGFYEYWEKTDIFDLKNKEKRELRLRFLVPIGSTGKYGFGFKILDKNFFIDPTWETDTNTNWDFGDYNFMYSTNDGNLTLNGQLDYNTDKSFPSSYASDLNLYVTFNGTNGIASPDGNATFVFNKAYGTAAGKFPQYVADFNKNGGADTNSLGLWDTNAGNFDGANASFQANDSILRSGAVTVCVWIMPKTTGGGGFGRILDNGKTVLSMNGNGSLNFSRDGVTNWTQALDNTISLWKWTHVCVVTNSAGGDANWFINGQDKSNSLSKSGGSPATPTDTMKIGNNAGKTRGFNGYIEEIKVYNRAILFSEALADYNSYFSLNTWGSTTKHYASYESSVVDANRQSSWNSIKWSEFNVLSTIDINAQVRSCNDAVCNGESWSSEIDAGNTTNVLSVSNNRYFQYKLNYYTNFTGNDLNNLTRIGDVNVDYTPLANIDVNVWKVDGWNINNAMPIFRYSTDGNLTIDFNVASDTNFGYHYADLNYSTSKNQGTGSAIITGLKIDSNRCQTNFVGSWNNDFNSDVNLVAYYKFDSQDANVKQVFDYSGKNNHLEYYKGSDNNVAGKWDNNAGFFDGNVSYASKIQANLYFDLDTGNFSFTQMGWVKFDTMARGVAAANRQVIVRFGGSGSTSGDAFMVFLSHDSNTINATDHNGGVYNQINGVTNLVADRWYHFAHVSDKDANMHYLYLNGKLDVSGIVLYPLSKTNSQAITVGGNTYPLDGSIEEIKVYNRALTSAEVLTDYNLSVRNFRSCEWDWNISGVADANYYSNILVRDDIGNTDYNWSNNNFEVNGTTIPANSCSCPASGWWEIRNSDICNLANICSLNGGGLKITDGSLTILNGATLEIPSSYKIIVEKLAGTSLVVEQGGKLVVSK